MKICVSRAIRFPAQDVRVYSRIRPRLWTRPGSVAGPPRSEASIVHGLESGARYTRRARDIAEISTHTGKFLLESTGITRFSPRLYAGVSLEWFVIGLEHLLIARLYVAHGHETPKIFQRGVDSTVCAPQSSYRRSQVIIVELEPNPEPTRDVPFSLFESRF